MKCGKPSEFEVGYDGGTGPLWDEICDDCLPVTCRLLGRQIDKWGAKNVRSYPSSIHVGFHGKRQPCTFDPDEDPGVDDNPEMPRKKKKTTKPERFTPKKHEVIHFPSQGVGETLCELTEAQATSGMPTMVNCQSCLKKHRGES